ncbi:MAG: cyclase family protein [Gemmatimonadaceae bacterium]|nr:cyclase family protein [Gemmatimonadaceae bacterium]
MSTIYDISAPIRSGGVVYPGNPQIDIKLTSAVAKGATANVSQITFGSHTGTHADSSRHFFDGAQSVDQIPLDRLIGPARLVVMGDDVRAVGEKELRAAKIEGQKRVLIRTRNSGLLMKDEFVPDYTYIAPDAAKYLVDIGVELVGVDYLSIEQFHSGHHLTHRTLLEKDVVIIEGLALAEPPAGDYQFICLPLRLEGLDGAPARAVLIAD